MAKSQKKNAGSVPWAMPPIPGDKKMGAEMPAPPKKLKKKPGKKKV